jgi:hypothetical protein
MVDEKIIEEIKKKIQIAATKVNGSNEKENSDPAFSFEFKTEEEVKEYFNNLETEYSFQCYSEKLTEGCERLGTFFESIRRNFKQANNVYKMNCDVYKYPRSCYKYSMNLRIGRGKQSGRCYCNLNLVIIFF